VKDDKERRVHIRRCLAVDPIEVKKIAVRRIETLAAVRYGSDSPRDTAPDCLRVGVLKPPGRMELFRRQEYFSYQAAAVRRELSELETIDDRFARQICRWRQTCRQI
jgi:hypothetical protein